MEIFISFLLKLKQYVIDLCLVPNFGENKADFSLKVQ